MNVKRVAKLVREILVEMGEDPAREGLRKTPERVAKAYEFLTAGYRMESAEIINRAIFKTESNSMILLKNIEIYSLCEHHMLPFFGKCHIGYISRSRVIGVSKIARLADYHARRLQTQERLTAAIGREIMSAVDAEGVGVVMECRHLCMMMRGVEKQNSLMTTSSVLGSFHNDQKTRAEFFSLIGFPGA